MKIKVQTMAAVSCSVNGAMLGGDRQAGLCMGRCMASVHGWVLDTWALGIGSGWVW